MVQLAANELSDTILEPAVKLTFHGFTIGYECLIGVEHYLCRIF